MPSHFFRPHLERVSRSFSFCIEELDGDFKDWVSLSYLLCRILDTVEDANWALPQEQARCFRGFRNFLEKPADNNDLRVWIDSFPSGLPEGEKKLLEAADGCFARFHALPENIRLMMRASILNMFRGMEFFSIERKRGTEFRLHNLPEVNQYCFFVAGVVGDLLTNLLAGASKREVSADHLLDAHHFGLFLQKVNLLKDQKEDEQQGRHLVVPSRDALLKSIAINADGALRYILALPTSERGYRTFCAWSLFIGLGSLRWMERSTIFGRMVLNKPPRIITKWIIWKVKNGIDDNNRLSALFQKSLPHFPAIRADTNVKPGTREKTSLRVYEGPLGDSQFQALGLI